MTWSFASMVMTVPSWTMELDWVKTNLVGNNGH